MEKVRQWDIPVYVGSDVQPLLPIALPSIAALELRNALNLAGDPRNAAKYILSLDT